MLSSASFSHIAYLIPQQNYANIHARLCLELSGTESSLFAGICLKSNAADWYVDDEGEYKSYGGASPEEKELIALTIEQLKASIYDKLAIKMPYVQALFRVPSEEQIFFCRNIGEEGGVKVVLTQWGFKQIQSDKEVDIIDFLLRQPRTLTQTEVVLHIDYSDGLPASYASFSFTLFGHTKTITTDENGDFYVGSLFNGKKFSLSDQAGERFDFEVQKEKNVYKALFTLRTSCQITLVNQENEPKAHFPLFIDDVEQTTDENGIIRKSGFVLTPSLTLRAYAEGGQPQTYSLERAPERNDFVYVVQEKLISTLEIRVCYEDGEPLCDYPVELTIGSERILRHTADDGLLFLSDLVPDTGIQIADAAHPSTAYDFVLQRGHNVYELCLKRPEVKRVRIRLLDIQGDPLPSLCVKFRTRKGEVTGTTDNEGNIWLPASDFKHKEKVRFSFEITPEKRK